MSVLCSQLPYLQPSQALHCQKAQVWFGLATNCLLDGLAQPNIIVSLFEIFHLSSDCGFSHPPSGGCRRVLPYLFHILVLPAILGIPWLPDMSPQSQLSSQSAFKSSPLSLCFSLCWRFSFVCRLQSPHPKDLALTSLFIDPSSK